MAALRRQADACERCDLYKYATQTVFGEGPSVARVVLVGEQPGDQEDTAGKPFVGPAGRLLDECLQKAGVDRSLCYVTNAVKHFKFERRGKRRLHAKPNAGEIQRCAWWLGGELALLRPDLIVALGATALYSLMGRSVGLTKERGHILQAANGTPVLVTIHPSYLLRIRDHDDRDSERQRFVNELKSIGQRLNA
ncbi:uracil-DNA glycosylase [Rhizobium leguminosarum]|uniref:Type-4 uracil-DNA glycosylase n=1 Tax=Rhizobium leguminosarum TaxID=384 RepID=A0ABD7PKE7_RHILE|nr:uracil-DNA glycosylase [Rhizobium leguminosarum]TAV65108.1 uracil-DNA glycosylase [Rhizobium leguminosarum]TAW25097.1 uracil-DNA glycosylase [Rhizobium leguminosarum]TAW38869.1 uracil-DNA glycosylase [Rhizobium leguminosarum]TAZ25205.1 uracil-DNA glycosylase [Rhizobium leguminosarum]